jgi:glycosyltransferase involved in cell wall biosynthesis
MKKVLVASFDLEVGGVERSLISLLNQFNYIDYEVDVMLYRHQGDFFSFLPNQPKLLNEIPQYATFRKSIMELLKNGHYLFALTRLLSKVVATIKGKRKQLVEPGYIQMQLMWRYALPFLPTLKKEYDVAISYLWPHYFIAEKVKARTKIAWIHTDYSMIETLVELDLSMWQKFDAIVAVSEACKTSFLTKYPDLQNKVVVIENTSSTNFIRNSANEEIEDAFMMNPDFKIVTVARLTHAKGIDLAVRVLRMLRDNGIDDVTWYVIGDGEDKEILQELIHKFELQEKFILLGKKINPYPYMKHCDLYVQPSRYEGKAVTVTEAQILGKPIMITNYRTAKSQVKDGIDGVIAPLSIEGIANGIEKLKNNPFEREKLKENTTKIEYSQSTELDKLYEIIN